MKKINTSYKPIEVSNWKRREHFEKWLHYDEPFHGVTVILDMTNCYKFCMEHNYKIFHRYMYHFVHVINEIEPFKYRIIDDKPVIYNEVISGLTFIKPNDTFAFGQIPKIEDYIEFCKEFNNEKQRVIQRGTLYDPNPLANIIHFSVLPWTNFVSLSHARNYKDNDSVPKVTFGKIMEKEGNYTMPMSIHVHHALVDGKDVGDFINLFQEKLQEN